MEIRMEKAKSLGGNYKPVCFPFLKGKTRNQIKTES